MLGIFCTSIYSPLDRMGLPLRSGPASERRQEGLKAMQFVPKLLKILLQK
jgi:hypothetical protein